MSTHAFVFRPSRRNLSIIFCLTVIVSYLYFYRSSSRLPPPSLDLSSPNAVTTLVIAATSSEDKGWTVNLFRRETAAGTLRIAVYVVDDDSARFRVPANKGHEAMVYLTYIIDHYNELTNVTMFMHNHQRTWHNNDLLFSDATMAVQRLRPERVLRYGYMNLRCHLEPGCPTHVILDTTENDIYIPEAVIMKEAWKQIFPDVNTPAVLSQPCCGQFAVSADRIREIPLSRYVEFRKWLLDTDLDDSLSGRVWEYLWQWIFAGVEEFCPEEHVCYCDGYGVCFGGKDEYDAWFELRSEIRRREAQLNGNPDEDQADPPAKLTEDEEMKERQLIESLTARLDQWRDEALERGLDANEREKELGFEHSL